MILNFYYSESSVKPLELDEISSKKVVYFRKNISEVENKNDDGEVSKMYTYQEAKFPKEDYELYKTEILNDIEISELRDKNNSLNKQIEMLTGCLLEMSETVYA